MNSTASEITTQRIGDKACDALFGRARTHSAWLDRPVDDGLLHQIYDLMKWGPTSANCCPVRILFLRTRSAKERLRPALQPGNVEKTMKAPVTAIIAYDSRFYELLPRLFPAMPGAREMFAKSQELADSTAMRNGSLQGAYFMLAARSIGLDCGPMSGFDNAKVDQEFFSKTVPWTGAIDGGFIAAGPIKSNFLCNLGYGDAKKLLPRGPRLGFDEACMLL